ncbi:phosphatase PAP2 family protein [Patescibacteria group bacterium]|nr:phosphatase PAP2 family protein [Patescibacteria group bacterium]
MRELLKRLDRNILKWAYQKKYKQSLVINLLIFMGDGPFWMIVVLFFALIGQFFDIESVSHSANLLIFGLMLSNFMFSPLKKKIKRKRPYANSQMQKEINLKIDNRDLRHGSKEFESFPSGHAFWTSLSVFIIISQFGIVSIFIIGWLIPIMIYLRLHLGVHYPSDVIAGFLFGAINAMITIYLSPTIKNLIDNLKHYDFFIVLYWVFIAFFLIIGFKSWSKRV